MESVHPHGQDAARAPSWVTAPRRLDILLPEGAEPLPGAHILGRRRGYLHHGIYVGDGRVVHYGGLARGLVRAPVEEVLLAEFARGRRIWTRWSDQPSYDPEEVIRRARSRVGENEYALLRNNCEHFCEWCLRGEARSYQVERLFSSRKALKWILPFLAIGSERQWLGSIHGSPQGGARAR